jgi:hypothetical protein
MYRMEQSIYKRIREVKKTALCLFVLSILFLQGVNAQTAVYTKAESFLFSFVEENDLFLADYGDNAFYLQRMNEALVASRAKLLGNTYHLLIVAHVNSYNYTDDTVINEASLRASRIRAYLKLKLNIPHECVAFYIDRSGDYSDQVHVYQVHAPLPWFANQEISCSESRYPNAISTAVNRYGAVPFVNLYSRGSSGGYEREVYVITDPLFDRSELEDYRLATVETESIIKAEQYIRRKSGIEYPVGEDDDVQQEPIPTVIVRKSTPKNKLLTKRHTLASGSMTRGLAIKTNLIPWVTVAPSMLLGVGDEQIVTGAFMPNLEVEYYFGNRWSVALAGMYADFAYKDKTKDHWAISSVTLSPKVWPLAVDGYRWLNTGLFFQYGDFDVRGDLISKASDNLYGRTGRFISLGASVGCLVPLGAGFCTEASLSAGYRSVYDGKKYRYDNVDAKNYLETRFSSTGFMLGFNISLVYRFQIR